MASTDTEIERDIADAALMRQAGSFPVSFSGMGGKDKYGAGAGGRFSTRKKLADDLDLEGYIEGNISSPKGGSTKGEITGGGVKLTKRFKKGGSVKSSASKRADGCAQRGKTRGKMV